MDTIERDSFLTRYMAMWHEPDAARRRALVQGLWAEGAENLTRNFTAHGMEAIVARVAKAHEEWVARQGFIFRPAGPTDGHNHLIRFTWEMVPRAGGPAQARGLDVFVLDGDGRIRSLYQFAEPLA